MWNATPNWSETQHQQGCARWCFSLTFSSLAHGAVAELFWDVFFSSHIHSYSGTWTHRDFAPLLCEPSLHPPPTPPQLIHVTAAVLSWEATILLISSHSQQQLSCVGLLFLVMSSTISKSGAFFCCSYTDISGSCLWKGWLYCLTCTFLSLPSVRHRDCTCTE